MLIVSRFSHTPRKSFFHFHFSRHAQSAVARSKHKEPSLPAPNSLRNTSPPPRPISSDIVIKNTIAKIGYFLRLELCLKNIEGFIHKSIDKALLSTTDHQRIYESIIVFLIRKMWPQPAATVYDRMSNQGFISSDAVDARMLVILLADTRGSAETVLRRILDIVSNPDFSDQHFLAVLNVAEDYNVRPKFVIAFIQSFLRAKGPEYGPRRGVVAAWLRAAVKLRDVDLMRDILELGNSTLKLSAIVEAWEVADKLDDCLEKLGKRLVGAVANPIVKEAEFLRAVKVIKGVGMKEEIVAQVCASFLANREADYLPKSETVRAAIETFIRTDRLDDAFALLCRVGIQPGKRPIYRTFLANLRDTRPLDHHSFSKLLSAIDAAEIPLDTSLLNVLISREIRLKRAVNALSMFNEMKKNSDFLPDSYTFGSLFSMYRRIRPRSVRRYSLAESLATPTFPLRQLFHELMETAKRGENPVRPDTALLNAALKAFMRQRDYAGAIIAIGTFNLFKTPLDNKTYYSVVKLLVRRVWAETQGNRPETAELWVERFLGVRHYCDIELGKSLVYQIFAGLCKKQFDLSAPLYIPKRSRVHRYSPRLRQGTREEEEEKAYYKFPTMEMMESLVLPEPVDFLYDPVPLMRLLSRAVFADAVVPPEEASRKLDESVRQAEGDMIPESCHDH